MKKTLIILTIGSLGLAAQLHAQTIVWGSAHNMTGNPDISTVGSYYDAVSLAGPLTVNNGIAGVGGTNVLFNAAPGDPATDGTISITYSDGTGAFGAPFTTGSPSSSSYSTLVNTGAFNAGGSDTVTIGGGLIVGDTYQVESWSYYTGDSGTATTDYSGSAGPDSVSLLNATGQYAVGTFVATASPEYYLFTADGGHGFVNDVSVRNLTPVSTPEPATWAMMLGWLGLLGIWRTRKSLAQS